jgi:hypothetical protein
MRCLTNEDIQAVVDHEAREDARAHADACATCRERVAERRRQMAALAALTASPEMPASLEGRVRRAVIAGRPVQGATALRSSTSPVAWRRAGVVSAVATAAVVALVIFGVLPRLGAPTSLSAAEVLGRSLQTLTNATGIERVEYELVLTGLASGTHRIEHLIDHDNPSRYHLRSFGPDDRVQSAIAQDPSRGRRSQLVRVEGRNYIVNVPTGGAFPSVPQMAQAQIEAVIGMMQATSDQNLSVVSSPEGTRYIVEIPAVVPSGPGAALDLYQARAVIDGRDFRIQEFDASGALLKQPYTVSFRLIRREALSSGSVGDDAFTIPASAGDVVLDGEASDEPWVDVLTTALREIGRLTANR